MPPYQARYSETTQGRLFCIVIHLRRPSDTAFSRTMLDRLWPSSTNADFVIDLHTPGIALSTSSPGLLTVTVHNFSFQLLCSATSVQRVPNLALQYQLQLNITQRDQYEFAVEFIARTDEADSPAVRCIMDIFCQEINIIEERYPPDKREFIQHHEDFKHLTSLHRWLVDYKIIMSTNAQRQAIDELGRLLRHGNQNRNRAFNGWTIPVPLSNDYCATIRDGFIDGSIWITEKGTPDDIRDRREQRAFTVRQLRQG